MKILLAIDGSEDSKSAIDEIADRPFPPNKKMRIVSAYQTTPRIAGFQQIGVPQDFYTVANKYALNSRIEITEHAAKNLRK